MQNKNNLRKDDTWSLKAKKEGYPGRAYYKLEEIDNKFKLLKNSNLALDLGCSPGGWSLYMLQKSIKVIGLDLLDLQIGQKFAKEIVNMEFIKGDFNKNKELISSYTFDIIVSDMAPNTTGNRTVDCISSLELALSCLDFSRGYLKKGGNILIKFFSGEDNQKTIEKELKSEFKDFKFYKPTVSRSFSFELFAIGFGKK